jgi:hypothetical protein
MGIRVSDLTVKLGLDWGSASPGCVLFGAALPDGHAHIWDELKFQRQTVKDVAGMIKDKCKDWGFAKVPTIYCDPALKIRTGQIGEDYIATFARHGVVLVPVSNDRNVGWQRVHEALSIDPATGTPWLTVHPRCKYLIRTLPLMVQDKNDPEDLDTATDDHPSDALRYLLMGGLRPGTKAKTVRRDPPNSWAWWRKYHSRQEQGEGVLA